MASDLLNHPKAPIHEACLNWPAAKAAYRLFDNNKFNESSLMQAHRDETVKKISESSSDVILAIQDTTTLNYTHHPEKKMIYDNLNRYGSIIDVRAPDIGGVRFTTDGKFIGFLEP